MAPHTDQKSNLTHLALKSFASHHRFNIFFFLFYKQDATYTDDKDHIFADICARKSQLLVSIDL